VERKIFKREDWKKAFPDFYQRGNLLKKIKIKIRVEDKKALVIGETREKMVMTVLEKMKRQGKIRDYIRTEKFGYLDLILGVDFIITYVNDKYRVCQFSVTGPAWVKGHKERHPEIPIVSVKLNENKESIEKKILKLKI
jgi:hypothetical protein